MLAVYVVALIAVVVGVDVLFFRDRFWERLIVNIGIVLGVRRLLLEIPETPVALRLQPRAATDPGGTSRRHAPPSEHFTYDVETGLELRLSYFEDDWQQRPRDHKSNCGSMEDC